VSDRTSRFLTPHRLPGLPPPRLTAPPPHWLMGTPALLFSRAYVACGACGASPRPVENSATSATTPICTQKEMSRSASQPPSPNSRVPTSGSDSPQVPRTAVLVRLRHLPETSVGEVRRS